MPIESEHNWSDNLHKCPQFPNIEIASYECCQYKCFGGIEYQDHIHPADGFKISILRINCEKLNYNG